MFFNRTHKRLLTRSPERQNSYALFQKIIHTFWGKIPTKTPKEESRDPNDYNNLWYFALKSDQSCGNEERTDVTLLPTSYAAKIVLCSSLSTKPVHCFTEYTKCNMAQPKIGNRITQTTHHDVRPQTYAMLCQNKSINKYINQIMFKRTNESHVFRTRHATADT
jgi:hypothetical protein